MAPKHHARAAATRGSSSAHRWQDLRQYARLARSEGVSVEQRPDGGILITIAVASEVAGTSLA